MRLFTTLIIAGLLLLQSCANNENAENKNSIIDSFNRIDSGLLSTRDALSDIPPPPPPPIPKSELVEAKKLAADHAANRSLADKKYNKVDNILFVEGIVKDIREPDDYKVIIILDGTPSSVDIQCETINSRRVKNLTIGMKATFIGHYSGFNGSVILAKCLYIENPTYE